MTTNIFNTMPYLRSSREYPDDPRQLAFQVNLSYVDIANAVNLRTIGIFPTVRPVITGESYFLDNNRKQQSFRQIYTFTTTANIPHGIDLTAIDRFVNNYGQYTDGTNWYGLFSATSVAIAGQITFYVDPTSIVFVVDVGAPALTSGTIVLHWLSRP